jgi:hypothetical protein
MCGAYTGVIHCIFDQIPNLQNCFTTPNITKAGLWLRHLPPSSFKKSRHLGFGVFLDIWSIEKAAEDHPRQLRISRKFEKPSPVLKA